MRAKSLAGLALLLLVGLSAFPQAVETGSYPNLFASLLGASERVYYPVGEDMAYIKDIGHNDVRSEGMSCGMIIAVQLDKKLEFDRIWKWASTY